MFIALVFTLKRSQLAWTRGNTKRQSETATTAWYPSNGELYTFRLWRPKSIIDLSGDRTKGLGESIRDMASCTLAAQRTAEVAQRSAGCGGSEHIPQMPCVDKDKKNETIHFMLPFIFPSPKNGGKQNSKYKSRRGRRAWKQNRNEQNRKCTMTLGSSNILNI